MKGKLLFLGALFGSQMAMAAPRAIRTFPVEKRFGSLWETPTKLAFSRDGKTLLGGGENCALQAWNVASGKRIPTGLPRLQSVYDLHFSPDGKKLGLSSVEFVGVRLFDWPVKNPPRKLWEGFPKSRGAHVWKFSFSPDGKRLASNPDARQIQIFNAQNGQIERRLQGNFRQYGALWNPRGNQIAAISVTGEDAQGCMIRSRLRVWNLATGRLLPIATDSGSPLGWSQNGRILWTRRVGRYDSRLGRIDLKTGRIQSFGNAILTRNGDANPAAFSSDDRFVLLGEESGTVRLFDARNGRLKFQFRAAKTRIQGLAFAPDNRHFVVSAQAQPMRFYGF